MREALTARVVVEILLQGVDFKSNAIRELPLSKRLVDRTLRALTDSGVIMNCGVRGRGRYRLSDEFIRGVSQDISRVMPRGTFLHYPALKAFDICGVGGWTEDELEVYVGRLREHWQIRRGQQAERVPQTSAPNT